MLLMLNIEFYVGMFNMKNRKFIIFRKCQNFLTKVGNIFTIENFIPVFVVFVIIIKVIMLYFPVITRTK